MWNSPPSKRQCRHRYVTFGKSDTKERTSTKTGTNYRNTSMIALRLCRPMFALWCMLWVSTHLVVSTQMTDAKFEIEKGIRYECGVIDRRSVRSRLQCAGECAKEKSCYGFNFGSGQCELLSATASSRIIAPGWTHGYYPTGKYETRPRKTLLVYKLVLAKLEIC